ncbi:MAG: NAD-dependent deacylase [Sandaracinobacteroides sp.]
MSHQRIVILTGAGISAESGVPTFRGPDGLWEGQRVEDVATPQAFRRDPLLVQTFYDQRRAALSRVQPNAAHLALARLDADWPGDLLLVTQNVDDLHERAGSKRLIHMHGQLKSAWCMACDRRHPWDGPLLDWPPCPTCGAAGQLRPDIVWFGEMPYAMAQIEQALLRCDLFVSIGTSGNVYPAAGFVDLANQAGARCIELNLDPSMTSHRFSECRLGPAGLQVPRFVDELLA